MFIKFLLKSQRSSRKKTKGFLPEATEGEKACRKDIKKEGIFLVFVSVI